MIKVIRELAGVGPAEAKDVAEALPALVIADCGLPKAEHARGRLHRPLSGPQAVPTEVTAMIRPSQSPAPPYRVWLLSYPAAYKFPVIKALRELTEMGAKEARDLAEGPLPALVYQGTDRRRLELARRAFAGHAEVEIRPQQP
jgi:ribosomal protein L7/L12